MYFVFLNLNLCRVKSLKTRESVLKEGFVRELTDVRIVDYPKYDTSYEWTAGPVGGEKLNTNSFYFAVENGLSDACAECVDRSAFFKVLTRSQQDAQTKSSHTSSAAGTGATNQGGSSGASAPAASGTLHSNEIGQTSSSHNSHLGIGLGVGLGLGIPILLAIIALLFFLRRRRRKQNRRVSYHPTSSGNWTHDETGGVGGVGGMREVGGAGIADREPQSRSQSLQSSPSQYSQSTPSQQSNPFRPSTALSHLSHTSWIDSFEFERPEMKDQDAMSQLRSSIHKVTPSASGTGSTSASKPNSIANAVIPENGELQPNDESRRSSDGRRSDGNRRSGDIRRSGGIRRSGEHRPQPEARDTVGGALPAIRRKPVNIKTSRSPGSTAHVNAEDTDMSFAAGTDLSSLEGMPASPEKSFFPEPAKYADGRNWPLAG